MKLNWGFIFDLIEQMTNLNSKNIADLLYITPSPLSRLRNGKTKKKLPFEIKHLYEYIFDPTCEKSPFYGQNEKRLLKEVKEIIIENGLNEELADIWDKEDYKTFMMEMFRKTKIENTLKLKSILGDISSSLVYKHGKVDIQETESKDILLADQSIILPTVSLTPYPYPEENVLLYDESQSEQMIKIFKKVICDCNIVQLMNENPSFRLCYNLLIKAIDFRKVIDFKIRQPFSYYQEEAVYKNIAYFTNKFNSYCAFLVAHMRICNNDTHVSTDGEITTYLRPFYFLDDEEKNNFVNHRKSYKYINEEEVNLAKQLIHTFGPFSSLYDDLANAEKEIVIDEEETDYFQTCYANNLSISEERFDLDETKAGIFLRELPNEIFGRLPNSELQDIKCEDLALDNAHPKEQGIDPKRNKEETECTDNMIDTFVMPFGLHDHTRFKEEGKSEENKGIQWILRFPSKIYDYKSSINDLYGKIIIGDSLFID